MALLTEKLLKFLRVVSLLGFSGVLTCFSPEKHELHWFRILTLMYPKLIERDGKKMSILFIYWLVMKVIGWKWRVGKGSMDAG